MRTLPRTRYVVERDLADAIRRREQAARASNFDEYGHLTDEIDALLDELHDLPTVTRAPKE